MHKSAIKHLPYCNSLYGFSVLTGIREKALESCLLNPDYSEYKIRKKNGGVRKIQAPGKELKTVQKEIRDLVTYVYQKNLPKCVHGFVKRESRKKHRSILSNAVTHIGRDHILNIDIKDYFPTVNASMIKKALMKFPGNYFCEEIASIIALLSTKDWILPVGSPSSPALSNIVFYDTDKLLQEFSKKNQLTYTRYADDLTFSSGQFILSSVKDEIISILNQSGFQVNTKKLRFQSKNTSQYVTGIKVNEKPNIDRRYIRNLRAILHDWELNGLEKASHKLNVAMKTDNRQKYFLHSLKSRIGFVQSVRGKEDIICQNLQGKFNELSNRITL